jgi:hypothetical protein
MSWCAEFLHDQEIEWKIEFTSYRERHFNAATRERYDDIESLVLCCQSVCEKFTSFSSVAKLHTHGSPCSGGEEIWEEREGLGRVA